MNTIKLNIGLENNPCTSGYQVGLFLSFISSIKAYAEKVGEYNGEPERTAVFLSESEESEEYILNAIEYLTELFTQDCIAVKINDVGYLVYNPEYKGEKFEFNNEYFIEP